MANTVDQAIAWAKAHPTKDVGEIDDSWDGWCAALTGWASGTGVFFPTALAAGNYVENKYGLNPDWRKAPRGARHYWAGVWVRGVECGHVADDIGNDHTLLMASSRVSNFGNGIGTIRFADYGLPLYRGWSMYWGDTKFANLEPAGLDPVTIDSLSRENTMYVTIWNNHILSFGEQQVKHETKVKHAEWVRNITADDDRYIKLDNEGITAMCETFQVPWYAVQACLNGKAFGNGHQWSRLQEVAEAIKGIKPTIDYKRVDDTIEGAIKAAIAANPIAAQIPIEKVRDIAAAVRVEFSENPLR